MSNPNQVPIQWTPPTTTDNVTTGPLAHAQQELNIRQRAHQQAQVPYERYGPTPEQLRKEIAELVKGVKHQPRASIKFSVTGQSNPITFTPAELYEAASDPKFAERIYTATTGMANASRRDIEDFQARIRKLHPEVLTARIPGTYGPEDIEDILVPHPTPVPHVAPVLPLAEMTHEEAPALDIPGFPDLKTAYEKYRKGKLSDAEMQAVFNEISAKPHQGSTYATIYSRELADYKNAMAKQEKKNKDIAERPEVERQHKEKVEAAQRYHKYQQAVRERDRKVEEHRAAMALNPATAATQKQVALEELKNAVRQRAGQEGAERQIYEKGATVAPLNEFHKQAERINLNSIGSQDEDFKLAQQAVRQLQGRKDMADVVQPYLTEAMKHPREFVNQYHNAHESSVIDEMRKDAHTNFLEKVLPAINARFPMGSGVREAILQSHADKMQRDLDKNIAELRHRNFDNAMRMSEGHRNLNMQGAQVAGNAELNHNQRVLSNLNALQGQNIANKSMNENDARNAMQMGTVHQQQAQNIMNRNVAEFERAKLHEPEQLRTEIENINHLPITQTATRTLSSMPPPQAPSFPGVMGGILGQTANMYRNASLQPPQGAYRGGHMKFAQGGTVAQHEGAIQSYADKVAKTYFDPLGNWMSHMTPAIFQAAGAPELAQAARGEHASREAHQDRQAQGWKTAADLHNTLLQSKFDQKRILQEYQRHKENLAETSRHNRATEEYKTAKQKAANTPQAMYIEGEEVIPKRPRKFTAQHRSFLNKNDAELQKLQTLLHPYEQYKSRLEEQQRTGRLPWTGQYAVKMPEFLKSDERRAIDRDQNALVKAIAGSGGRETEGARKLARETKLNQMTDYPAQFKFLNEESAPIRKKVDLRNAYKLYAADGVYPEEVDAAWQLMEKNGGKGNLSDYVKAVVRGEPPKVTEASPSESKTSNHQTDSNANLFAEIKSLEEQLLQARGG